ncbi:MAG: thiamine diphosphokinase [Anaerolineales bacterium]
MLAIIFANGEFLPPADLAARLANASLIVAADGGGQHCLQLGILPDVLIGDLDSISADARQEFESKGVRVLVHPVAKEQTDLELALAHAKQAGANEIVVLAGLGRRWDHSLANLMLAAQPQYAQVVVSFLHGEQRLQILRGENKLTTRPGERISLLPLGGDVSGIVTKELAYPLENETLIFGSSRGVSNVVLAEGAQVNIGAGVLLCVISPPDLE